MSTTEIREGDLVPYEDELLAGYRADGLLGTGTVAGELRRTADCYPELAALRAAGLELTYAELDRRTDWVAVGLADAGLLPGERVLLQLDNSPWAVLAWYGVLKAGLVPVATLAMHRRHEIEAISRQCEPAAHLIQADFRGHDLVSFAREMAEAIPSLRRVFGISGGDVPALEGLVPDERDPARDAEARRRVDAIQQAIDPDALAVLQLSGGTTSIPKLIPRLHAEYWYNARAYAEAIDVRPGDSIFHAMPVIHNAGIVCGVHAAHAVGACFALSGASAAQMGGILCGANPPTHMLVTRPLGETILANAELRAALARTRVVVWASGKLPAPFAEAFETETSTIVQMFGMGEGLCLVTPVDGPVEVRHHTVGTFICPRDEIRVYLPGSEELAEPGTQGELCVRGPYSIRGYFRAPERNAEAFTADGFYRTGDVVREVEVDVPGRYFTLEDRMKDLINRGGEKINAQEVEQLLERHPSIDQAAVVAMPDPRLGERACAFVVPAEGWDAPSVADVQAFFTDIGVAKFKWPERIEARDELPLTNVLKLNKVHLRREIVEILELEHVPN